jgi:hypothetical protein
MSSPNFGQGTWNRGLSLSLLDHKENTNLAEKMSSTLPCDTILAQ